MQHKHRILMTLILTLLLSFVNLTVAQANSAEPPGFTVLLLNGSEDVTLSLQAPNNNENNTLLLSQERKGWELYYKFFYYENFRLSTVVKLVVKSETKNFECELPSELFQQYNNIVTLDMETESLTIGQPPYRATILVLMRVILTLVIEGALFYAFGYRERRSWSIFFILNILTQGWLNLTISGPILSSYWFLGYFFIELIILLIEMTVFLLLLKESRKSKAALFAIVANLLSLILGGFIISSLPV